VAHVEAGSVWEEFLHIATDPAHLLFELLFSVVFDVIIVSLIWGVVIKKIIIPRIKKDVHAQFDEEHGFSHDEN
jgi:hypothetical protein